jgi:hypothetical protein
MALRVNQLSLGVNELNAGPRIRASDESHTTVLKRSEFIPHSFMESKEQTR